jgi:hypothetical protein
LQNERREFVVASLEHDWRNAEMRHVVQPTIGVCGTAGDRALGLKNMIRGPK